MAWTGPLDPGGVRRHRRGGNVSDHLLPGGLGERAPAGPARFGHRLFPLMGTISVVVISYLSGILFDRLGFVAPFLFLARLNMLFVFAAGYFMVKRRGAALAVATR